MKVKYLKLSSEIGSICLVKLQGGTITLGENINFFQLCEKDKFSVNDYDITIALHMMLMTIIVGKLNKI